MKQLQELDEEDFHQLCATVGMATKPFHVMRFRKALRKLPPNTNPLPPSSRTPQGISQLQSAGVFPLTTTHIHPRQPIGFAVTPPHSQPLTVPIFPTVTPNRSPTVHVASVNVVTPQMSYIQSVQQPHAILQLQSPTLTASQKQAQTGHPDNKSSSSSVPSPSRKEAPEKLRKLFLPPYLKPGSDCRSFDDLIDDLTPVQKELGPCPFSPNVWDSKRAELIRKYSTIYGQNVNKRKHDGLTSHEENVNEAANQLCLRDPTLLVRREELLVLARRAVKEGGYVFIHGFSRTKDGKNSLLQKRQRDAFDEEDLSQLQQVKRSSPAPKLRERRVERIAELDLLIGENKAEQSMKLAGLEKAQQSGDFSAAYHIQFEMEALGSTLHRLQKEYSALKKKQRRSERYFESKQRGKDAPEEKRERSRSHSSDDDNDDKYEGSTTSTAIDLNQSGTSPAVVASLSTSCLEQQPSQLASGIDDDLTQAPSATVIVSCSSTPLELVPSPHGSRSSTVYQTAPPGTNTGHLHPLANSPGERQCVAADLPRPSSATPITSVSQATIEAVMEFERKHALIFPTRHLQPVTAQVLRNRPRATRDASLHVPHNRGPSQEGYAVESRMSSAVHEMTRLLSEFNQ